MHIHFVLEQIQQCQFFIGSHTFANFFWRLTKLTKICDGELIKWSHC